MIHQKEESYEVKWKGTREHTIEPRSTLIEDIPKMIKTFEREHNVEWRNGRCYYDEKRKDKPKPEKTKKKISKIIVPTLPKNQNQKPKTSKIINSSVAQTNVLSGKRERKNKTILDF